MAGNPNPQHVPTDGVGVAAYVQLSGTGLTNPSGGTLTHPGSNGANGQGIGATAGGVYPAAQYALTLSLTSAGGHQLYATLTASAVDAIDNSGATTTYDPINSFIAESYNDPANGSPAWYKPSAFAGYNASVASAAASGTNGSTITITALAVGQAIVEVSFPTFDNTGGNSQPGQPINMIYCQVIVTVVP